MKVIIQRVSHAKVEIRGKLQAEISNGFMILVGFKHDDTNEDILKICSKIIQMRIFGDENGKMNLSIKDIDGEILLVSQFTLYANSEKGNRPSFTDAARPEIAIPLYEKMIVELNSLLGKPIQTGVFGEDMQVSLCNNGPVTITLDTKK